MNNQDTSLLIPSKLDRFDYLLKTLECVRQYSFNEIIIITNTNLSESQYKFINDLKKDYNNLIHSKNSKFGISQAINHGLKISNPDTNFVTWLGDDDYIFTDSITYGLNYLRKNSECILTYGQCDYINSDDQLLWKNKSSNFAVKILTFGPNLIPQPGIFIRKAAFIKVGGVQENYSNAFDHDLYIKLKRMGKIKYFPLRFGAFRWHRDSTTVKNRNITCRESRKIRLRSSKNYFTYFIKLFFLEPLIYILVYFAPYFVLKDKDKIK